MRGSARCPDLVHARGARPARAAAEARGGASPGGDPFKEPGADLLFVHPGDREEVGPLGGPLPPPLMMFAPPDGFAEFLLKERDLAALGFRLAASSGSAFAAMVKAVRQSYECLAQGRIDPFIGKGNVEKEIKAAMATAGLARLLEVERRTMPD